MGNYPPLFILTTMKQDLTEYDVKPAGFVNYLRYYGEHFNKKLCEFACKDFPKKDYTKEKLETLMKNHNIQLPNAQLYDSVYVINWAKSQFYGSGISDEKHLALFVKDLFEKEAHLIFNRWYADMAK